MYRPPSSSAAPSPSVSAAVDPNFELKKEFYLSYDACRNPAKPPAAVLRELDEGVLRIPDLELSAADVPAIDRFLRSKLALDRIHTLVVCRVITDVPRKIRALRGLHPNGELISSLLLDRARLFLAIAQFIGRSRCLRSISFDSVHFTEPVLDALASALTKNRSGLISIRISHSAVEDAGLRRIVPSLARLPALQSLTFESCRLTDNSIPMIISILKASSAILEAEAWNTSLREPNEDEEEIINWEKEEEETRHQWSGVHGGPSKRGRSVGLVALSLAGNRISDIGLELLGRTLRKDRWLLGLNMWANPVTDYGIERFSRAIASSSSVSALGAIVLPRVDGVVVSRSAHDLLAQIVAPHAMLTSRRWSRLDVGSASRLMSWSQWQQDIRFKPVFDRSQSDQATEGFGASSLDGTALASNAGGRSSGGVEAFEFLAPPTDNSILDEDFVVSPSARHPSENERPPSRLSIRPRPSSLPHLQDKEPHFNEAEAYESSHQGHIDATHHRPRRAASSQSPRRARMISDRRLGISQVASGKSGEDIQVNRRYTERSQSGKSSLYNSTVSSRASMVQKNANGEIPHKIEILVNNQPLSKKSPRVPRSRSRSRQRRSEVRSPDTKQKQMHNYRHHPSKSRFSELDDFSQAIHSVTSNLEKVSIQLQEITCSLANTLNMSMMTPQSTRSAKEQPPLSASKASGNPQMYRETGASSVTQSRRYSDAVDKEDDDAESDDPLALRDQYADRGFSVVYDHEVPRSNAHDSAVVSEEEVAASSDGELADLIKDSIRRSLKSAVLSS